MFHDSCLDIFWAVKMVTWQIMNLVGRIYPITYPMNWLLIIKKWDLNPPFSSFSLHNWGKKTQLKHSCSWNLGLGGGDLFCRADARFREPRESAVDRGIRTGCLRRNWRTTSQPLTVCLEYIYVNRMIPVPDVIQLVFRIPCVLRLPAFQWHATEARSIFLVLGHLSQTLRLAVNPLKYNGECRYCVPV